MTETSYSYPDGFFGPPKERSEDWPDGVDLRRAVDWFKGLLGEENWRPRRSAAADRLYNASMQRLPVSDQKGRLFEGADTFGWYLFLAEAFLDHNWNYEPVFGSRVVPVFAAIGRDLPLLLEVDGLVERAMKFINADRAQPNGGVFELLVAAAYKRAGASVTFVSEQPGKQKTHDLDVELNGQSWAVECKRMEVGDYGERERERIRALWGPLANAFASVGSSVFADIHFLVPIENVPEGYLRHKALKFGRRGERAIKWSDKISAGIMRPLDLSPLRAALEDFDILTGSSRLIELLAGDYVRNASYNSLLSMKHADNPRYIEDCNVAVLLRWETLAPASIDGKARDIFRKLIEAVDQIPADRPSVVHIGFEAVEGDRVERARYQKILQRMSNFDPRGKPLEYVYCHYLVPESPPDEIWAFDETTQWLPVVAARSKPLEEFFLVVDAEGRLRRGPHWEPQTPE